MVDRLGKPNTCEHCGNSGLVGHKIHWANKNGKYLKRLKDWIRLCAKCHGAFDKALGLRKRKGEQQLVLVETVKIQTT